MNKIDARISFFVGIFVILTIGLVVSCAPAGATATPTGPVVTPTTQVLPTVGTVPAGTPSTPPSTPTTAPPAATVTLAPTAITAPAPTATPTTAQHPGAGPPSGAPGLGMTATAEAASAANGRALFTSKGCNNCHPNGQAGVGPSLVGVTNRLTEAQIRQQINNGGTQMPPYPSTDREIADLIAFLRTLR